MEFKADALVLRAADWGEYDKIVTLFTAERGKLSAALKGVKRAGAKLKFAAQPFCFAEFVFVEKSGRNTVISASLHDGFYALREDIACYYAAVVLCEACDQLLFEGIESPTLFLAAVRTLEALSSCAEGAGGEGRLEDGKSGSSYVLLQFLLTALKEAGYPVSAGECPHCGEQRARAPTLRSARRSGRAGKRRRTASNAPCAFFPPIFLAKHPNFLPLKNISGCEHCFKRNDKRKKDGGF